MNCFFIRTNHGLLLIERQAAPELLEGPVEHPNCRCIIEPSEEREWPPWLRREFERLLRWFLERRLKRARGEDEEESE